MSDRVLTFVNWIEEAGAVGEGSETVVLSPWWTAGPASGSRMIAVRPLVQAVLAAIDLPATSIDGLDRWAAAAGLPELFHLDGIAWWDRVRMAVRWDVYELVLWRHVLTLLDPADRFDRVLVPADRPALAAACRALGLVVEAGTRRSHTPGSTTADLEATADTVAHERPAPAAGPDGTWGRVRRVRRRVLRVLHLGSVAREAARSHRLDERLATLAARPGVLVVTWAGAFQVVGGTEVPRLGDPYLDPAIDRLVLEGDAVTVAMMGRNHRDDAQWPAIEADPRVLPFSYIGRHARAGSDAALDSAPLAGTLAARSLPRFDVAGCDIAPAVVALTAAYCGPWLDSRRRWFHIAGRFLDELKPRALLIDREGTRAPWIAAAQERRIPVITTQHGMIYPGNPEYFAPRTPGSLRPDRTCVFGPYERDLLVGGAGYAPDEVVVTGSPRVAGHDPVRLDDAARDEVRRRLGVAPGSRALLVSAAHNAIGDLLTATMMATVLDGPLPGVHVVVKLHPQDQSLPDYAALLAGMAAAGGYGATPVTVVRDIELGQVLAAVDAHLGHSSTVLTDAVAAGIPNLVALGQAQADPIGYVRAGVAVPVRSVDEVRAAMADPAPPSAGDRDAFLDAHFRTGDAVERLVGVIHRAAAEAGR